MPLDGKEQMLPTASINLNPLSESQFQLVVRTVTVLVGISAVIVAASFPLAYFYAAQSRLKGEIAVEARLFAGEVATATEQNPDFWNALAGSAEAANLRALEITGSRESQSQIVMTRRIFRNADGKLLLAPIVGISLPWLSISARHDFLRGLGTVEVSTSLTATLWNTAAFSLASVTFAILLFYILREFPLRLLLQEMRRANYLAQRDPLTGLFNRTLITQQLDKALSDHREVALLLIDLDDFKTINDTYGHDIGDKVLAFVARELVKVVRTTDVVARLGGDEFAIVLVDAPSDQFINSLCDHIASALMKHDVDALPQIVKVNASIGISRSGDEARTAGEILKNADLALYQAKADGQNLRRFYDPLLHEKVRMRSLFESDLREALSCNEFFLVYQPQVVLKTGEISGAEALLRWHRLGHGVLLPEEFIPCAESIGCIREIGAWVLAQACHDAASWPRPVDIAVNISPWQFRDGGFVETVRDALSRSGLKPGRLVLEVAESPLLTDMERLPAMISELQAIGVRVALDAFGTGLSSLSYLTRCRFDIIEIDRSYMQRAANDSKIVAVLLAILRLADLLGLSVTAEGIETETQAGLMASLGCTKGQGLLFGRPEPRQSFIDRLAVKPAMVAHR